MQSSEIFRVQRLRVGVDQGRWEVGYLRLQVGVAVLVCSRLVVQGLERGGFQIDHEFLVLRGFFGVLEVPT